MSDAEMLPFACPGCGYSLTGLPEPRCPECGQRIPDGEIVLLGQFPIVYDSESKGYFYQGVRGPIVFTFILVAAIIAFTTRLSSDTFIAVLGGIVILATVVRNRSRRRSGFLDGVVRFSHVGVTFGVGEGTGNVIPWQLLRWVRFNRRNADAAEVRGGEDEVSFLFDVLAECTAVQQRGLIERIAVWAPHVHIRQTAGTDVGYKLGQLAGRWRKKPMQNQDDQRQP